MRVVWSLPRRATYTEYLAAEQNSDCRHEFIDGVIVAMAGGSDEHNAIASRFATLFGALAGGSYSLPGNSGGVVSALPLIAPAAHHRCREPGDVAGRLLCRSGLPTSTISFRPARPRISLLRANRRTEHTELDNRCCPRRSGSFCPGGAFRVWWVRYKPEGDRAEAPGPRCGQVPEERD